MKEGNTCVYKNKFPIRTYISDGFIYDTLTTFDTMYVSRKILNNDGKELFEIKVKYSYMFDSVLVYNEYVFGQYFSINDFVYKIFDNNSIWRGIPIKNEAENPGKRSGGGDDCSYSERNPVIANATKFNYSGKNIDAYLSIFESYCIYGGNTIERTEYYYADGIGLLKAIRNPRLYGGYTSKELIYFSELQ